MIKDQRLLSLARKVISINSENPPGQELALARFVAQDMRSLGLDVRTYTFASGRPNVVATLKGRWPRKEAARTALLLTPHIDTVPIGQGWTKDPLKGVIAQGKLYGRGATDDKGNLASAMEVMRSLVEEDVRLNKDVIMAATVDEETGSHHGIIPLLDKKILKPAFALVLDSDEMDVIVAQKGLIHARIEISGKKAHGAYNWRGVNAIEQAAEAIRKIKKIRVPEKRHRLLHPFTVNIGVIKGGDKVNMVADRCHFSVDIRYLPGTKPQAVMAKLRQVLKTVTSKYKMTIDDCQMPYEIDHRHPYVQTFLKAADSLKAKATIKGSNGATVITFFQRHKIPAVATGFGAHGTAHTNDEYIRVKTLCRGTRVLERFVREYDEI